MIVEIYELLQTEEEHQAEEQERTELIRELGLKEAEPSVVPFPEISVSERRTYETLFPEMTDVPSYRGYLPTRVLRTYKAFREEFNRIEVWSDRANDPIMVGKKGNNVFLMARWGDAIDPLPVLREKAIMLWKERRKASLEKMSRSVDIDAVEYFSGKWIVSHVD